MARAITQERLAELVDLNLRTVQKIEAGQINILITTVIRIQKALRCPWRSLLEEHKPERQIRRGAEHDGV